MTELMERIVRSKERYRKMLALLPVMKKLEILDELRQRIIDIRKSIIRVLQQRREEEVAAEQQRHS